MGRVGGHCNMTNMDEGALRFIVDTLSIKSMIDVGCGPRGMVCHARAIGLEAYGIDGDKSVKPDIFHNFDDGPIQIGFYDLAWSIEFLEHIEEKYLDNVFSVFDKCRYVFCTHNEKPGPWHFNCKSNDYWIGTFEKRGWVYDEEITDGIKKKSTMEREFVSDSAQFYSKKQR
jgi:hypothetical protein